MTTIVLCSYMVRYPVGGVLSSNLQLLTGFARLGHDVYLVEKAGYPDSCFDPGRLSVGDDCAAGTAAVDALLCRHGLRGRWCYVDAAGTYHGMGRAEVEAVFRRADLFVDRGLHRTWNDEAARVPVRVLLDPDPGYRQARMAEEAPLAPGDEYDAFYTYGHNVGTDRSTAPATGVEWRHMFHPVDTDLVTPSPVPAGGPMTTVMNWKSLAPVQVGGQRLGMKDAEFAAFEDLPARVPVPLEVALQGGSQDVARLRAQGWRVRAALDVTRTYDSYHHYVERSLGEFSVAKNVYVALNAGWFSDRSAAYLARGRPVVVQDNGLAGALPLGEGLFAVRGPDEAAEAIAAVAREPQRHGRVARRLAEEHLSTRRVLGRFLDELGLPARAA